MVVATRITEFLTLYADDPSAPICSIAHLTIWGFWRKESPNPCDAMRPLRALAALPPIFLVRLNAVSLHDVSSSPSFNKIPFREDGGWKEALMALAWQTDPVRSGFERDVPAAEFVVWEGVC